jgi:hypothetical protein
VVDDQRSGKGVSEILLDRDYLLDYLGSLPKETEHVTLAMVDAESAVMFTAHGQGQHLVMPLSQDDVPAAEEPVDESEPAPTAEHSDVPLHVTVGGVRAAVNYFAALHDLPCFRTQWTPAQRLTAATLIRTMRSNPLGRSVLDAQLAGAKKLLA